VPVPEPKQGETEEVFVSRCIDEMHKIDPKGEDKQIQAICFSQWRESKGQRSEPIPILRSFESGGVKYVSGYAAIFDSEDSYGTAMAKEAVESSRERLQSFPAVRFMHRVPFGQIDFDNEVKFEGKSYKTFIDDHGFHVLCRVYDQCENEWSMVKSGKWGFSYGFMPDVHGGIQTRKLANGHTCPVFVKGTFYEVSVVDTPAHADAAAYVVSRMIHSDKGENVTKEAKTMPEDKKEIGNKEEFEKMLKDAEERMIANVTKAIESKKSTTNFDESLKAMEQRILMTVDKKFAEQVPEKSRVDQTFEGVNTKLTAMEQRIMKLKGIENTMKGIGEDTKAISERIAAYEKQRDALVNSVAETVEKTVKKSLGDVEERLSAIEGIPDLKSPATLAEQGGVRRGMGFGEMLEASRRGTSQ